MVVKKEMLMETTTNTRMASVLMLQPPAPTINEERTNSNLANSNMMDLKETKAADHITQEKHCGCKSRALIWTDNYFIVAQ